MNMRIGYNKCEILFDKTTPRVSMQNWLSETVLGVKCEKGHDLASQKNIMCIGAIENWNAGENVFSINAIMYAAA